MEKNIKLFLDFGIYNNNLYFPNTLKKTKEYIDYLNPLIEEISKLNKDELTMYINENDINIYSLSICIGILGLDKENYQLISKRIKTHKELFVFVWIYTTMNPIIRNKYLNSLYMSKLNIIENNIPELFNVYKPSYSVRKEINRKIKEKYKIRYIIESQEDFESLLDKIKEYKISPNDIDVEMGFTFDPMLKNDILDYFLDNFEIVDLIYKIDKWFIEVVPVNVLEKIREKLDDLSDVSDIYDLLVINTSLKHIELTNVINEQIKQLSNEDNKIKLNINYMPNMKINMKWDKLHTYNSYVASVISILNENFDSLICLKEKNISSKDTFDIYSTINNNSSFSLDKASKVQKNKIPSILFANDYAEGYDILWDISSEGCPIYLDRGYLVITGKNTFLIESAIEYLYSLDEDKENKKTFVKKEEVKEKVEEKIEEELYKENNLDNVIDDVEESLDIIKNTLNNVKFKIRRN